MGLGKLFDSKPANGQKVAPDDRVAVAASTSPTPAPAPATGKEGMLQSDKRLEKLLSKSKQIVFWAQIFTFSILLVNVICLLSINFTLGGHVRTAYDKYVALSGLSKNIRYLDELLTMSARMAAYSGDPIWESRYNENVGPIDMDIKAVQRLAPELAAHFFESTDAANQKLIEIETLVLSASQQNTTLAVNLISSQEYAYYKEILITGLTTLDISIVDAIALQRDRMDSFSRSSFYGTIGLSVIIVLLAAGMFWLTNRHSRQDKEEIFKLMVRMHNSSNAKPKKASRGSESRPQSPTTRIPSMSRRSSNDSESSVASPTNTTGSSRTVAGGRRSSTIVRLPPSQSQGVRKDPPARSSSVTLPSSGVVMQTTGTQRNIGERDSYVVSKEEPRASSYRVTADPLLKTAEAAFKPIVEDEGDTALGASNGGVLLQPAAGQSGTGKGASATGPKEDIAAAVQANTTGAPRTSVTVAQGSGVTTASVVPPVGDSSRTADKEDGRDSTVSRGGVLEQAAKPVKRDSSVASELQQAPQWVEALLMPSTGPAERAPSVEGSAVAVKDGSGESQAPPLSPSHAHGHALRLPPIGSSRSPRAEL